MNEKDYAIAMHGLIREAEEALAREDKQEYEACLKRMRELTLEWNPSENGQRPNVE